MNVIIVKRDGTEETLEQWQLRYGLEVGSDNIGVFFSLREDKFQQNLRDYGVLVVNELLIRFMDGYRAMTDVPTVVNAFNRNDAKQQALRHSGFRAATYSPHVVKMAGDLDTPGIDDLKEEFPKLSKSELWERAVKINRHRVELAKQVSKKLGIKIRIGSEQYLKDGNTFIHVDVCPEYYAPGKPFHDQKHPVQWESELRW